MLPSVKFCGLDVTRLVLGANPFGGFSHQSQERDMEMLSYHTLGRIRETWERAEAAGINTMVTNNETPHVIASVREYKEAGGVLQWIAQINCREKLDMYASIDETVAIGCSAVYFHGALVDNAYREKNADAVGSWCEHARKAGVPAGVAGHAPEAHLWVDSLGVADFHAVCFFNCGSLHQGKGHIFRLADIFPASECVRRIQKPCIAYKVMGAGRIDPRMALEFAFGHIKPGDVVNMGMFRGDLDDMVEKNATLVQEILDNGV